MTGTYGKMPRPLAKTEVGIIFIKPNVDLNSNNRELKIAIWRNTLIKIVLIVSKLQEFFFKYTR